MVGKAGDLLQNRAALITGATSGIGRAIAMAFADENAELYLVGRNRQRLSEVEQDAKAFGNAAVHSIVAGIEMMPTIFDELMSAPVSGDLTDKKTVDQVAERAEAVDILVNNAGMLDKESILEGDPDRWQKLIALDLLAPMRLTNRIAPHMAKKGYGNIINISSMAGKEPMKGFAAYAAAKFGLTGWSLSAFEELRDYGIRVSAIFPGYVATEMTKDSGLPQDKMIRPEDIAEAALLPFRMSERAVPTEIVVRPSRKLS